MSEKLTREECLKALNALSRYAHIGRAKHGIGGCVEDSFVGNNAFKIYFLIKEHFDNPPLKFEELKAGMWVWDNKFKVYNQIHKLYGNIIHTKRNVVMFKYINETTQWGTAIEFEENRFFRKQVEE